MQKKLCLQCMQGRVHVNQRFVRQVPDTHIVFRQERNFENFGAGYHRLLTRRRDGFPGNPVHLIEWVWPDVTLIRCPDEHLQADGFFIIP